MPILRVFESKSPQVLVLRAVFTSRVKVHPFIRHRGNRGPERLVPARPPEVDGLIRKKGASRARIEKGVIQNAFFSATEQGLCDHPGEKWSAVGA